MPKQAEISILECFATKTLKEATEFVKIEIDVHIHNKKDVIE